MLYVICYMLYVIRYGDFEYKVTSDSKEYELYRIYKIASKFIEKTLDNLLDVWYNIIIVELRETNERGSEMAKQDSKKMTAEEARSFERVSLTNAGQLIAEAERKGCECKPYSDWFTYKRWTAQGYQVRKGQHGYKLSIIIRNEKQTEQEDGTVKTESHSRPWMTTVFCRCQVDKVREAEAVVEGEVEAK